MQDFNQQVIKEFRENAGKVGGQFEGAPMVLLTTTGAKSGQERTIPLVYFPLDGKVIIVASKGGAPTHPDWYHNLVANPTATVEIGTEKYQATAVALEGVDRDETFAKIVAVMPGFGEYQANTERTIPVIELQRI